MLKTSNENQVANYIAMVVITLMAVGAIFVFSSDVNIQREHDLQKFYTSPGLRQAIFFPLAVIVMFAVSRLDYHRFNLDRPWKSSVTIYLLGLSLALLLIVLVPKFGTEINQARRWLRIPLGPASISFQPSELAKWTTILFLAGVCDKYSDSLGLFTNRFVPICAVVGIVVLLIVSQDLGTAAFVALLAFIMLAMAGAKWLHLLAPLPFCVIAFLFVLKNSPARMLRISAFLNPTQGAGDANYQANQSLIALGSGGIWGKGLGMGICKYSHLPEDTTDFIFAIIGEELGFAGCFFVILLFIIFVWLGIIIIFRCKDRFGQLLSCAIVMAVGIQAALNLGVVTVVLPTKGIPLPFVSSGGTSLLLSAAAIGVLLNIAQQSPKEPSEQRKL